MCSLLALAFGHGPCQQSRDEHTNKFWQDVWANLHPARGYLPFGLFAMGLNETIAQPFPAILESATIAGGFRFFGLTQRPFITHAASFIISLVGWQNANDSVCDCGGAAYKGSGRGF